LALGFWSNDSKNNDGLASPTCKLPNDFAASVGAGLAVDFLPAGFGGDLAFAWGVGAAFLSEDSYEDDDDDFAAGLAVDFREGFAGATLGLALAPGFSSDDSEEGAFAAGRAGALVGWGFPFALGGGSAFPPDDDEEEDELFLAAGFFA
jgi:hypothetical protein